MERQEIVFLNSVFFVIGFVVVFSIVGILLQTLIAQTAVTFMNDLRLIGGSIIIIFGAALILSTKYFIPIFTQEYKFHVKRSSFSNSYVSSFIFGIAFAIGWTPCVGPILGSIYALAITSPGIGFLLLLAYSLGLGIPFLIVGAFLSKFTSFMKRMGRFLKYFNIISGLFLIGIGLLIVTDYIGVLSVFLVGTNGYISLSGQLNFLIAIVAGILTFLSPCILPLVPAYLSYIGGTTAQEAKA
jgi:cytochrome c-type biogenesis protein